MTLRERAALAVTRLLLRRLGAAAEILDLRAERDALRAEARDAGDRIAVAARTERDLRILWTQAEADAESLRRDNEEIRERHAEVLRVRETELAAALGLQRRSWPDLLAAIERLVHDKANTDQALLLLRSRGRA